MNLQVSVIDEFGKVEVNSTFYTGWPIDVTWTLQTGEVAELRLITELLACFFTLRAPSGKNDCQLNCKRSFF
ncbi:hypothetical protein Poly41_27210 [Novipirellula artificiosorum]|uniref:Uncharacterized protein n=1 Tax=Novipirellula artificiosorum TaxID=2528016 RepID=A0A5C6DPU0_9BACT|nr:hypothetical protein Poly41_27210 [Novipirellula artificiosorum]